jgi:hypothetical protein
MSTFTGTPAQLVKITAGGALGAGALGFSFVTPTSGFLNGRLRGNAHQDVAGVLLIEFGNSPTVFDLAFTVVQDASQPGFQYPFDVIILQPFVRVSFTNGGAGSTFHRANVEALPV